MLVIEWANEANLHQRWKFNRGEPLRETAENRKVLNYRRISRHNFPPSLRISAVKDFWYILNVSCFPRLETAGPPQEPINQLQYQISPLQNSFNLLQCQFHLLQNGFKLPQCQIWVIQRAFNPNQDRIQVIQNGFKALQELIHPSHRCFVVVHVWVRSIGRANFNRQDNQSAVGNRGT